MEDKQDTVGTVTTVSCHTRTFPAGASYQVRISQLEHDVTRLRQQSSHQARFVQLGGDIARLRYDLAVLENRVRVWESKQDCDAGAAPIHARIDQVIGDVAALFQRTTSWQIKSNLESNQSHLCEKTNENVALFAKVRELEARVCSAEGDHRNYSIAASLDQARIAKLEQDVAFLRSQLMDTKGSIRHLGQQKAQLQAVGNDLWTVVRIMGDKVDRTREQLDQHIGEDRPADVLRVSIATLAEAVEQIRHRLDINLYRNFRHMCNINGHEGKGNEAQNCTPTVCRRQRRTLKRSSAARATARGDIPFMDMPSVDNRVTQANSVTSDSSSCFYALGNFTEGDCSIPWSSSLDCTTKQIASLDTSSVDSMTCFLETW